MTIELEALVSKFQAHRNKKPGKKVNYPQRLAKAVAHLDNSLSPKSIAKALGVSDSSVIAWRRKYSPSSAEAPSFIPVAIETSGANADVTHVKLVFVEATVPTSSLATTIREISSSLGCGSC